LRRSLSYHTDIIDCHWLQNLKMSGINGKSRMSSLRRNSYKVPAWFSQEKAPDDQIKSSSATQPTSSSHNNFNLPSLIHGDTWLRPTSMAIARDLRPLCPRVKILMISASDRTVLGWRLTFSGLGPEVPWRKNFLDGGNYQTKFKFWVLLNGGDCICVAKLLCMRLCTDLAFRRIGNTHPGNLELRYYMIALAKLNLRKVWRLINRNDTYIHLPNYTKKSIL
jgi:hypothetical protein